MEIRSSPKRAQHKSTAFILRRTSRSFTNHRDPNTPGIHRRLFWPVRRGARDSGCELGVAGRTVSPERRVPGAGQTAAPERLPRGRAEVGAAPQPPTTYINIAPVASFHAPTLGDIILPESPRSSAMPPDPPTARHPRTGLSVLAGSHETAPSLSAPTRPLEQRLAGAIVTVACRHAIWRAGPPRDRSAPMETQITAPSPPTSATTATSVASVARFRHHACHATCACAWF